MLWCPGTAGLFLLPLIACMCLYTEVCGKFKSISQVTIKKAHYEEVKRRLDLLAKMML